MATQSLSLPSILNPKPLFSLNTRISALSLTSPLTFPKRAIHFHNPHSEIPLKHTPIWRISAASGDSLPLEANPVENSQQIGNSTGDSTSTIVSALLFLAFVGLSILTIGVVYIAVADFLQKRETEKYEKEEAAKKKTRKKKILRARTGPRGFGQKIEEDEDD